MVGDRSGLRIERNVKRTQFSAGVRGRRLPVAAVLTHRSRRLQAHRARCRGLGQAGAANGGVIASLARGLLLLTALMALAGTACAAVLVQILDGNVTIDTGDASRADALKALAEAAGFTLEMNAEFTEPVWLRLNEVPLAVAVQRLTRPHSSVVLHAETDDGRHRIATVKVYRRIQGQAPTASGERRASVRTRDTTEGRAQDTQRLSELADILEDDSDRRAQRRAIAELRSVGGEVAVRGLIPALQSNDRSIRSYAVAVLGQLGSQSAVGLLGQVATEDEDPDVRIRAIIALSRQHSEQARQIVEIASGDDEQRVRDAARARLDAW